MGVLDRIRRRLAGARSHRHRGGLRQRRRWRPRRRRRRGCGRAPRGPQRRPVLPRPGRDRLRARGGGARRAATRAGRADDAVWALAEELAHSPRAWYPLIELGRLSVHDDREQALRRLATASDRDPTGCALAEGRADAPRGGPAAEALGLGVGHWRPRSTWSRWGASSSSPRPRPAAPATPGAPSTCWSPRTRTRQTVEQVAAGAAARRGGGRAGPRRRRPAPAARSRSSTSARRSSSSEPDPPPRGDQGKVGDHGSP